MSGSASIKDRQLIVTLVNPAVAETRETEVVVRGATPGSATVTLLTAAEMNAHNSFEAPDAVKPTTADARVGGGSVIVTVPPKSVAKIEIGLA